MNTNSDNDVNSVTAINTNSITWVQGSVLFERWITNGDSQNPSHTGTSTMAAASTFYRPMVGSGFFIFVLTFEIFHSFQQKRQEKQDYFSKGKKALCKYEDFEILNLLNATISTCQSSPIWLGHLCPLITYFYSLVLFIGWMRMPSTALPSFSQPSMRSLQGTKRKKFSIIESL